jgi:hypothetical protein
MAQQARNLGMFIADQPEPTKYVICDRDTKFTEHFKEILKSDGVEVLQTAICAPDKTPMRYDGARVLKESVSIGSSSSVKSTCAILSTNTWLTILVVARISPWGIYHQE